MKTKIILSIVLLSSVAFLSAKEAMYPVSEIPASLKENAHTVMRLYKQEIEIKSEKSVILTVTEVRTILNKNGENNSYLIKPYDSMQKITSFKGKLFNEQGIQIHTFGAENVIDRSAISGFSLYEDHRIKIIDPKYLTYPFTIEYTYQIEFKQTLFIPAWNHGAKNTSFENSSFVVKTPTGYPLRYKEYNLQKGVIKTNLEGKDIYTWTLNNLKARIDEPMSSITNPDYPLVDLAPKDFYIGETTGSAENWKELGKWASTLIEGKDQLPETTIAKMKEITSACKSDYEKVKTIYEYMQQKTRYVNIAIGIGGWQPFNATVVDKFSYGDCKALSNYTKSLLSAVGIKSLYTLVLAGNDSKKIDDSFPSSQFNHVMVCVPLEKDTIWLECTSQRLPCGFNGDFTDDRQVLLVDGENSRLVHTRSYPASENNISRRSIVSLQDETSGTAEVKTIYNGLCYDDILPIYNADNADKKRIVTQRIELPSFTLNDFKYTEHRSKNPYFDESLTISIANYMHKLGNDITLLPLNFMNKLTSIPEKVRNRKSDFCIRRPYMENDTVVYKLPNGYNVTEMPVKSDITGKFGTYTSNTLLKDNSITYIRHFELKKGEFPPEEYTDFRDFMEQVSTADEGVASLKRK
jgi:hypothetical protein